MIAEILLICLIVIPILTVIHMAFSSANKTHDGTVYNKQKDALETDVAKLNQQVTDEQKAQQNTTPQQNEEFWKKH